MKKNIILIAIIILLLLVIVSGIIVYMIFSGKTAKKAEEPRKIDKNVITVTVGDSFVNNVKDSKKMCKLVLKFEIDKKIEELMLNRESEIRDKINLLIRSKTELDLAGQEGQLKLQKEILQAVRKILNSEKVVNVFFDEFIVQ